MLKLPISILISILVFTSTAFSERVYLLKKDDEALQARVDLIDSAHEEILAEYYSVWNDEQSLGGLTLLLNAAQNGKKVKIILDAMSNTIPKALFAALLRQGIDANGNQNLEIRLYNKFNIINPLKALHRDHAKMLIVDGKHLILGGRNVGDKYFGLNKIRNFLDLDIITEGKVAEQARNSFMSVWNSKLVSLPSVKRFSEESLNKKCPPTPSSKGRPDMGCESARDHAIKLYNEQNDRIMQMMQKLALQNTQTESTKIQKTRTGKISWLKNKEDFDDIRFISHDEEKLVSPDSDELSEELVKLALSAKKELNIMSPYLIPTKGLTQIFKTLIARGVKIRIVTNSLNSTDNLFAQAGYRKSKEQMIKLGIELYEYNGPDTAHAKAAIIDSQTVFVGTYNLDPRSAYINREVGIVVTGRGYNSFVQDMTETIEEFRANSLLVGKDGEAQNKEHWDANVSTTKKILLQGINLLLPLIRNQL